MNVGVTPGSGVNFQLSFPALCSMRFWNISEMEIAWLFGVYIGWSDP